MKNHKDRVKKHKKSPFPSMPQILGLGKRKKYERLSLMHLYWYEGGKPILENPFEHIWLHDRYVEWRTIVSGQYPMTYFRGMR